MDESGIGKNPSDVVCCVAGFICRNGDWKKFARHWRRLLVEHRLSEFKAKEFWARSADGGMAGRYRDWSFADANDFMFKAIQLVRDYKLHLLGCAVSLDAFFSCSLEERRFLTGGTFDIKKRTFLTSGKPSTAYFVALTVVTNFGAQLGASKKEMVQFVFDEQNEFSPLALQRIASLRGNPAGDGLREFVGDAHFSVSSQDVPLQCADLAAFTCKEYYRRQMSGLPIDFEDRAVITPLEVLRYLLLPENSHTLVVVGKPELDLMLDHGVSHSR